jgi:transcription elongation factor Elf1
MRPKRNVIYNPAALSAWRRRQKMEANLDEERTWSLTCRHCEHVGVVHVTLRQLRAARLVCSECSMPIGRSSDVR